MSKLIHHFIISALVTSAAVTMDNTKIATDTKMSVISLVDLQPSSQSISCWPWQLVSSLLSSVLTLAVLFVAGRLALRLSVSTHPPRPLSPSQLATRKWPPSSKLPKRQPTNINLKTIEWKPHHHLTICCPLPLKLSFHVKRILELTWNRGA